MPAVQENATLPDSEKRQLVARLTADPLLHGSEALCSLLRFLTEHSLKLPGQPLKEHQIATELFGRPESFDPRLDSTVRVQTSRLRSKLAEYYATSGVTDPWTLEIPRGSYAVLFHERAGNGMPTAAETSTPRLAGAAVVPVAPAVAKRKVLSIRLTVLGLATAVAVLIAAVVVRLHENRAAPDARSLETFWAAAIPHEADPIVIFSNAEFVGRPETGLRYFEPERDANAEVFDQYTGVGEVIAIHELDELFRSLGRHFVLKRGQLLTWDGVADRDLVFVGSPSENLPLRELALHRDFDFQRSPGPVRTGDLSIVNVRPQAGEKKAYFGSPSLPITDDYAVVELTQQPGTSRRVLLLAGTTTLGTEAAVEFVCNSDYANSLAARLGRIPQGGRFSALLHVKVDRGAPLETDIVAVRAD